MGTSKVMVSDVKIADNRERLKVGMNHQTVKWLPILMYHRVVDSVEQPDPYHISISTTDFEAQMSYLKSHSFEAIHLTDVPLAISNGSPWKKPVAITFDDGYLDTYTHAYPLLNKYGLSGTVMLVSGHIGGKNTWDYGKAEPTSLLSMSEIRDMEAGGMQFGSHGATHMPLTEMMPSEIKSELVDSKASLEDLLGHEVSTLAYPFGRSTDEMSEIAQRRNASPAGHTLFLGKLGHF